MLRISWQTLRTRRATLAGAFIAIWLAVTLAYATGMLMAGALSSPGPGRMSATDAVVRADPTVTIGRGEDAEGIDVVPAPRLPASDVARVAGVDGVQRAVGDVSFAAGVLDGSGRPVHADGADRVRGHGWASAALTPYRLTAGRAPSAAGEVVADARLRVRPGRTLRIVTPAGSHPYRVTGVADARGGGEHGQAALFFTAATAAAQSGAPGRVNAVGVFAEPGVSQATLRERLSDRLGPGIDVLDRDHAADGDVGDARAAARESLIAIFGATGGIAGIVALFVVAGTFGLAIAQRRRETAVLRALGATPSQVRRLIAGEALIVSLVASVLGLLGGGPLADAIAGAVVDHGVAPRGFAPGDSPVPLVAALGLGIGVAQLAVMAAAHRAGKVRPGEALREAAVEHHRPGVVRILAGALFLGGGVTMAIAFQGEMASAFAILGAMLTATGVALLGRPLLGGPAGALARPLRALGAPGLLAGNNLSANRWRSAALATPIVLVAMLVVTQGVLQHSDRAETERVSAARVTAGHVVAGRDGAPLPAGTAERVAGLPGVRAATGTVPTEVFLLDHGLTGWDAPWEAAGVDIAGARGTLDLGIRRGDARDVRGNAVAISEVVAREGHVGVGDTLRARLADTTPVSLRVAAVYDRAAGLGHVVLDPALARRHTGDATDGAVFVSGGATAGRSLERYAAAHPGVRAADRATYLQGTQAELSNEGTWGVWLVIGISVAFAALALVNTAAMSTTERRDELATIRLLGGTSGQATRMIALELLPTVAVALLAGAGIAALAVMGVPAGVRGIPLVVPGATITVLVAGTVALAVAAGAVTARIALRATPAAAMRGRD